MRFKNHHFKMPLGKKFHVPVIVDKTTSGSMTSSSTVRGAGTTASPSPGGEGRGEGESFEKKCLTLHGNGALGTWHRHLPKNPIVKHVLPSAYDFKNYQNLYPHTRRTTCSTLPLYFLLLLFLRNRHFLLRSVVQSEIVLRRFIALPCRANEPLHSFL